MKLPVYLIIQLFSFLGFSQQSDTINKNRSNAVELAQALKFDPIEIVDLGLLVLDLDEYYHYGPTDLSLLYNAHPKEGINTFFYNYVASLTGHSKYLPAPIHTSLNFIVDEEGQLGEFVLGNKVNKNDTLFVETLLSLGPWDPARNGKKNRILLKLRTKDQLEDHEPRFPGGPESFRLYLKNRLRIPYASKQIYTSRAVLVEFIVEVDGSVSSSRILKGIGPAYDQEVLRVINEMPKWTPKMKQGIPQRQRVERQIFFETTVRQRTIKRR